MKIEIWYEAPDPDVIDLNEEQTELFEKYTRLQDEATEHLRNMSDPDRWAKYREAESEAQAKFDELMESIYFKLSYPGLNVEEITEW